MENNNSNNSNSSKYKTPDENMKELSEPEKEAPPEPEREAPKEEPLKFK